VKKWNQFYPFDPSKLFGLLLLLCVFAPLREMYADPLTPEHLTPPSTSSWPRLPTGSTTRP